MSEPKTALVYERYELKYHIPLALVAEISDYIADFCELDHYSLKSPDQYYTINNLYLDTPNYLFFNTRLAGMDNRFNMRVRTYGTGEPEMWFLEVKHKSKGFVTKTRAKLLDRTWLKHLVEGTLPERDEAVVRKDYAYDFAKKVMSYQAAPVVFTQYRRKAFFSTIDDYARVTFDKELRYVPRREYRFTPSPDMQFYDHPELFDPYTNVVLELKCEAAVPWWMLDLIRRFNLQRASFSKFMYALNESMQDHPDIVTHPNRISAW